MSWKERFLGEAKKVTNFEDLRLVDKRILISVGAVFLVLIVAYYYYLFAIYPAHRDAKRTAALQQAEQEAKPKTNLTVVEPEDVPQVKNSPTKEDNLQLDKVPSNHMDTNAVSPEETILYTNAFQTFYNYFNSINTKNYKDGAIFFEKKFKMLNNITPDVLEIYSKQNYYRINDFYIHSITKADGYYNVKLSIKDKEAGTTGFFVNYKLVDVDNRLDLVIDDLGEFAKAQPTKK